ncbi:glycosyltransferase [Thalassococcus lentus]|uniref:Glycosyltransferase n=1 Tax=Thalassococcus lentus TaxID=1210524 RepID=A0ABT4XSR3_9RHOB|nr:glycosyltransferase [Thalassococcus lentus]MDA7424962.1 glycosyltransferase [Thalassococcus lentus]
MNSDFGTLRTRIVRLCADGAFVEAFLALEDAEIESQTAVSLWEYLERQMSRVGETKLASTVRARLATAGVYTEKMAIADAEAALEHEDFHRASLILRSAFGALDLPKDAARAMARALNGLANPDALFHLTELAHAEPDMAIMEIDLLRAEDALISAQDKSAEYAALFPTDDRFLVRGARIAASLNQWDVALDQWKKLQERGSFPRSTTLGNQVRLLWRLERKDAAMETLSEFLLAGPALTELIPVTYTLGLGDLLDEALAKAVQRNPVTPVPDQDWDAIAQYLLDIGRLGHVAWLSQAGIPIGSTAQLALQAASRLLGNRALEIGSLPSAARLSSPDCLLPFALFQRHARPAPLPPKSQMSVMLVNASLVSGGAERQFVMMVKALLLQGLRPDQIDVALFSLSEDRGRSHFLRDLEELGVQIHDLENVPNSFLRMPSELEDRCALLPKPLRADVAALYKLLEHKRPDVLHGWQDRASLACGFLGTHLGIGQIVLSARNMQPSRRDRGLQQDDRALFSALCGLPNVKLVANSRAGARDYEDWLDRPVGDVGVMNNGLEIDRFTKIAQPAHNQVAKGRRVVNIVGVFRLAPNKRPELWLETVAKLQGRSQYDIRPRIAGVGPLSDIAQERAAALRLRDFHLEGGLVDPADIYRDADVVLLMSRVEGTPNVLLEAQALGIAVAGCDVGGVKEAMLDDTEAAGLLLSEDITPEDAAAAIEDWLPQALNGSRAERMSFIANRFSVEALGALAMEYYGQSDGEGAQ